MKKLFCAIVAAICLVSCVSNVTDITYRISRGSNRSISQHSISGEAMDLIEAFTDACNEFDNNSRDWMWFVTTYGSNFKKGDADAIKEFEKYSEMLQKIYDEYEKKFAACTDETVSFSQTSTLSVSRDIPGGGTKELASKTFSIKLND